PVTSDRPLGRTSCHPPLIWYAGLEAVVPGARVRPSPGSSPRHSPTAHPALPAARSILGELLMKRPWLWFALALCPRCPGPARAPPAPPRGGGPGPPTAGAARPAARRPLPPTHPADSVSLVDLARGVVLAEQPCGRKPAAVACSADGRRAAVSNLWSGTVTLL